MSKYTEAQNRASQKYIKKNLESIQFRVKKGEREYYKKAAEQMGLSLAQFFLQAANEKIEREQPEV